MRNMVVGGHLRRGRETCALGEGTRGEGRGMEDGRRQRRWEIEREKERELKGRQRGRKRVL